LVGFALAMRRSELVALNHEDIAITADGLVVTIRRSKTDQEGHGRQVGAPRSRKSATCPVAALEAWLDRKNEHDSDEDLSGEQTVNKKPLNETSDAGEPSGGFPTAARNVPAGESWAFHGHRTTAETIPTALFTRVDHGRVTSDRLTGRAVAEIVKRAVARAGLDPARFSGHSLRSGFATSAARGGADLAAIMQQTGHKNSNVAMRYVQRGKILQNPASKAVKL
jgi:integrase